MLKPPPNGIILTKRDNKPDQQTTLMHTDIYMNQECKDSNSEESS